MRDLSRLFGAFVVAGVLVASCSSSGSQVASGPGTPVPTTPPLAVPPVLEGSTPARTLPAATTAPLVAPTPTTAERSSSPPPSPTAAATTPAAATQATTVEATPESAAEPTDPEPAPTSAATETASVTQTPVPTGTAPVEPSAEPAPTSAPGAVISLGDFDVVNLVTQQTQNIAELSPSGATMLWFWAPH